VWALSFHNKAGEKDRPEDKGGGGESILQKFDLVLLRPKSDERPTTQISKGGLLH